MAKLYFTQAGQNKYYVIRSDEWGQDENGRVAWYVVRWDNGTSNKYVFKPEHVALGDWQSYLKLTGLIIGGAGVGASFGPFGALAGAATGFLGFFNNNQDAIEGYYDYDTGQLDIRGAVYADNSSQFEK